jgi:hypothetical protein
MRMSIVFGVVDGLLGSESQNGIVFKSEP